VFASGPFFHSGSARTLDEVLENVQHRSLGSLGRHAQHAAIEQRWRSSGSIDANTAAFPERTMNEHARFACHSSYDPLYLTRPPASRAALFVLHVPPPDNPV